MGFPSKVLHQIGPRPGGGVEDQLLTVGICQTSLVAQPGHHLQEDRGVLSDALDLLQVLNRRRHHTGERAVAFHQGVGDGVGVLPRNRVIQQQFQGLVICKAIQPACQKAGAHLLSMSVVDAHRPLLPPCLPHAG